ncbi:TPR-like protein [Suillus decipiens]|nr:TPR-like protein [Suillus decipiens]
MSEPTATQLKDEGNVLFRKQDYVGALSKYTEAIALDDENAVLYANRAACYHGLNRYIDAVDDAKMATKIDPGYAKGWSRLAASRDALDTLPKTNLSPAEQRQKDQYSACLNASQARGKVSEARDPRLAPISKADDGNLPWQVARAMFPELEKAGPKKFTSSVSLACYVAYYR